jgi:hypothetical protein
MLAPVALRLPAATKAPCTKLRGSVVNNGRERHMMGRGQCARGGGSRTWSPQRSP